MTGTLPNLALAQRVDQNGLPASGARLFIFEANTSTPVISYRDYLMSAGMEHAHPIVADALGLIPMFWLPDGFYRARLEDRYGQPLLDEAVLPAIGTGEGGGGGGEAPAANAIQTGDFWWQPTAGPRALFVRANARTIGNAASGASERANADCANLFAFMWNNFFDGFCPVSGGRGASGPADFAANKTIGIYDMRGYGAMGLDGMGNTSAGRFAGVPISAGGPDTATSIIGLNAQVMTDAQMPYHAHGATTTVSLGYADPGHTHIYEDTFGTAGGGDYAAGAGLFNAGVGKTTGNAIANGTGAPGTGITFAPSATTAVHAQGGNANQNNVPYVALGTWYIRL